MCTGRGGVANTRDREGAGDDRHNRLATGPNAAERETESTSAGQGQAAGTLGEWTGKICGDKP